MNKNISVIYAIKNILKNRIYIGSTCHSEDRKQEHFRDLNNNKHANAYLQADYNICGNENFIFEILEEVLSDGLLCEREQTYIDQYYDKQENCYNIAKFAGRPPSIIWTQEMKDRLSAKTKGRKIHSSTLDRLLNKQKNPFAKSGNEHPKSGKAMPENAKIAISNALIGKNKSEKHCENISKSLLGKPLPEYVTEKFRDGRRKGIKNANAKSVEQYDLDGNFIKSWPLMSLAAKETGTNLSSISSCCAGKCKSANGFIWKKDIETLNKKAGDY